MGRQEFGARQGWTRVALIEQRRGRGLGPTQVGVGLVLLGLGLGIGVSLHAQGGAPDRGAPPARVAAQPLDARRQAKEAEETRLDTIAQEKKAAALLADSGEDEAGLARLAATAKQSVASRLREPSSAIYRNVIATEAGTYFCGEVNGRNGLGGYGEWAPFIAVGHSTVLLRRWMGKAGGSVLIAHPTNRTKPERLSELRCPAGGTPSARCNGRPGSHFCPAPTK
jgi:hypothetical protein